MSGETIGAIIVAIILGLFYAIPQIDDVLLPEAELAYLGDDEHYEDMYKEKKNNGKQQRKEI